MASRTNICDDRIDYEHPSELAEHQADLYRSAVRDLEDALAIITELQEERKNEAGEICEPPSRKTVNTIAEIDDEYLAPALAVLQALGCPE